MGFRTWLYAMAVVCAAAMSVSPPAPAATADPPTPAPAGPPMGWNSWDSGLPLTEHNIHAVIDAMVASGLRDAGYRYVNLDAGWAAPDRDTAGGLRADPVAFPHGIADLAEYAHARGMLLGLYDSPYNQVCGQTPQNASRGHERVDARTFAAWKIDFLKYDWCRAGTPLREQIPAFTAMRDALRATGRRIVYSINPNSDGGAHTSTYDWSGIADLSRTGGDLIPLWHNGLPPSTQIGSWNIGKFLGVADELGTAAPMAARSRPGFYNDPDMLVVGLQFAEFWTAHANGVPKNVLAGDLPPDLLKRLGATLVAAPPALAAARASAPVSPTVDEQRANLSLWAMLSAPLLAGNDVVDMTRQTRDILTNREVVAVDQDPLARQATTVPGDDRILVKPLRDGSLAVALLDRGDAPATIRTGLAALGLPPGRYIVRDLWAHTDFQTTGPITATNLASHAVALFRVTRS